MVATRTSDAPQAVLRRIRHGAAASRELSAGAGAVFGGAVIALLVPPSWRAAASAPDAIVTAIRIEDITEVRGQSGSARGQRPRQSRE